VRSLDTTKALARREHPSRARPTRERLLARRYVSTESGHDSAQSPAQPPPREAVMPNAGVRRIPTKVGCFPRQTVRPDGATFAGLHYLVVRFNGRPNHED
jgi:hypothetical protein